jgi:hypothetical protein
LKATYAARLRRSACDVYEAVEREPLFAMHYTEPNLECPVGKGIRPALGHFYTGVEDALRREQARTSIREVLSRTLEDH